MAMGVSVEVVTVWVAEAITMVLDRANWVVLQVSPAVNGGEERDYLMLGSEEEEVAGEDTEHERRWPAHEYGSIRSIF
jgi:hypothetical protein